ncbi:MAG TPA: GNAT family N-acetyltransferase, partial [Kofleriaceae bacterium]|nr:GNAT family N-acetyltransferase [Kofleriaceae bacterium]
LGFARKSLEVRWARGAAELAVFRDLYDQTMDRLGASAAYRFGPAYYALLADGLGDRLDVALAYAGGEPVAGAMFLADRDHAHYHLSATRAESRVRGATTLLVNEGAAWARARGCKLLQLGGGTGGADALYHFKRGFGGPEHEYGLVALVADAARYADLVARRAAAGLAPPRPGFFPAYRA